MTNTLRALALASSAAAAPLAASAVTVVEDGGTYDLLADSYAFDGDFEIGDQAAAESFLFSNTSNGTVLVTLGSTVIQDSAEFRRGVRFQVDGVTTATVEPRESLTFERTYALAAGDTLDLGLAFGPVVDVGRRAGGTADIDFAISAAVVPVPAAGLLLASAVGCLAVARRRKGRAA